MSSSAATAVSISASPMGVEMQYMSRLAEAYDEGQTRLRATEIADLQGYQRPVVAKILSVLSQAGLVTGSPGPGGGFSLARDPRDIRLYDVYRLFERANGDPACPFGTGVCRSTHADAGPCPMHERVASVRKAMDALLHETTFDQFRSTTPGSPNGANGQAVDHNGEK